MRLLDRYFRGSRLARTASRRSTKANPGGVAPRLGEGHSAGHAEHLAVDVARLGAREKDVRRRKLGRLGRTLHRRVLSEVLDLVLLERLGDERGPHWTGRNAIDANASLDRLGRESFGERHDGRLRRGVVEDL